MVCAGKGTTLGSTSVGALAAAFLLGMVDEDTNSREAISALCKLKLEQCDADPGKWNIERRCNQSKRS